MLVPVSLALGFLQLTAAHFILQYPPSLGFNDDMEGTNPCGGFSVSFNASDASIPVGGFPVSMLSTHPQAQWLFKATLSTASPFNWTNLLPVVEETGLGQFCIPNLIAPSEFAGHQGIIQVTQDAADGVLYQCAAVNFVAGVNSSVSSSCTNVTGLTASITNENSFNTTVASSSASGSAMASMTSSKTSASAAATSSSAASAMMAIPAFLSGAVLAVVPLALNI